MAEALSIDDLYEVAVPGEPALAPDGSRVVYSLRTVNRDEDRDEFRLWMLDVESAENRPISDGPADRTPVWSPDGRRIAWFGHDADCSRLWIMDPDEPGEPVCLAEAGAGAGALRWSPDGKRLAFLAPADLATALGDPSTADTRAPVVIRGLGYKADGLGLRGTVRMQPHVIEADGGEPRRLSDDDWNYSGIEWHPASAALLAVASGEAGSDVSGVSSVYELPVGDRPASARLLAFGGGFAVHARWLEDASAMLVVGQDAPPAPGHLRLFLVDPDGAIVRTLSDGLDRTLQPGDSAFSGTLPQRFGEEVVFGVNDGGVAMLYRVGLEGGVPAVMRGDPETGFAQASAGSSRLAGIVRGPHSFGELAVFGPGGERLAVTDHGAGFWAERSIFSPEAREFVLGDGTRVPGWVIRDPRAAVPGPLLIDIHGGPHSSWDPLAVDAHWYRNVLVRAGWTVLLLNPPASQGYGEDFYLKNLGTWGHGDQAAFLEPIDALVAEGIADESRLVVMGYSYGGYAVCWLTSQTDRFAAAIAGGVVSELNSLASSDLAYPELYAELGGTPWEQPEVLDAQSPFRFVGRVTTPTLILHGAADDRCPVNQAEQWFTALRVRKVPTEMVLYPGSSHLMILSGHPSHRADYQRRIVDWATRFTRSA